MLRVRAPLIGICSLALGGCGLLGDWLGGDDDGDAVYDGSRCFIDRDAIHCARRSDTLWTGLLSVTPRVVHWQVPVGEPPASGWPVAILFQGSLVIDVGVETEVILDHGAGHEWLAAAPDEVLAWFEGHR